MFWCCVRVLEKQATVVCACYREKRKRVNGGEAKRKYHLITPELYTVTLRISFQIYSPRLPRIQRGKNSFQRSQLPTRQVGHGRKQREQGESYESEPHPPGQILRLSVWPNSWNCWSRAFIGTKYLWQKKTWGYFKKSDPRLATEKKEKKRRKTRKKNKENKKAKKNKNKKQNQQQQQKNLNDRMVWCQSFCVGHARINFMLFISDTIAQEPAGNVLISNCTGDNPAETISNASKPARRESLSKSAGEPTANQIGRCGQKRKRKSTWRLWRNLLLFFFFGVVSCHCCATILVL